MPQDPRHTGEVVQLADGRQARYLAMPAEAGGPILWLQQDGTPIAMSGPQMTRESLIRIASSLSATADLGAVEARPEPTATPMPTPGFRVLAPTWLPEPLTELRQVEGEVVTLGYVPAAARAGAPWPAMTLAQMPQRLAGDSEIGDPQATRERIGDYDVTVVRRGQGCVTYTWLAGGLHLTLTNVYDPPGQLKYSCEEMAQVVASVR